MFSNRSRKPRSTTFWRWQLKVDTRRTSNWTRAAELRAKIAPLVSRLLATAATSQWLTLGYFVLTTAVVECRGDYQVASASFGKVISDRLHTRKSPINVETATLRVWLVELQSVVFAKDGRRYIRAMIGKKDEAQALAASLVAFAENQSVVVAPTSREDAEKVASMARLAAGSAEKAALGVAAAALARPAVSVDPQREN